VKNKIVTGIVVLAAVALVSGATLLAAATPGTQDDPLITLSYLTGIFRPQIMDEVSKAEQEASQRFDSRVAELEAQLEAGGGGSSATATGTADSFSVVTLTMDQTLVCSVGTEIMLRIGSASGTGSEPALVNYTSGAPLSSGTELTANHMYLVTLEGNGLTATADTVRVLIRGNYTIERE